ncbi:DNA helicase MCM8 [Agrilus planipennis]|uniref:DNA helicase MCM8 n=1 Tax=Agrilus planipennis TaxID=224129 RepID=A0A1W4WYH4_AGRPL|nr:DNA helicase MCM8 [Agrilus planipennis]XP_018328899.1 DNA helicase MCM8 [Agrilus planipennis]
MYNNFRKKTWFKNKSKKPTKEYSNAIKANASRFERTPVHGYYGFKLYFPEDSVDAECILMNTTAFEDYIQRNQKDFSFSKIKQEKVFFIDVKELSEDDEFLKKWKSFPDDIVCNTEYSLSCLSLAMYQILMKIEEKRLNGQQKQPDFLPILNTRIINFNPILQLKNLKVNYFGKLVTVRGTVIKAGNVKLLYNYIEFSCGSCSGTQVVKQIGGNLTIPTKCPTKGCRAQFNFTPLILSPYTIHKDWQTIKLQELVGIEQTENGRIPRTLECELTGDLVKCCIPGDDITVTGVIKTQSSNESRGKEKQASVFLLHMMAITVVNNKNQSHALHGGANHVTFNIKDYYAIQKIHAEPSLFRFLVHSLCPSIFGHEIVKAGLLLALFGGTEEQTDIRCVSHVLMVGDPGLGKSQLLQACTNVAPRGVYVCGNTSTSSGLTVTMTRDNGEFSLEAGALVLADQGCCCIDEFDKMTGQHSCLLEVMEQQSISIAKAGVTCNLPTRTTILAAANPAGGHYNKAKTVSENLKMGSPLLSRFDLVFIILDKPDETADALLSEHVLALHLGIRKRNILQMAEEVIPLADATLPLKERLKLKPDECLDYLPHQLFRKYIAYAQKYVHPQLSDEAAVILKEFYLELRKKYQTGDSTPITKRQLESLLRLTQARAKLELREEATAEDAIDVVEIMRHSLIETFLDGSGNLDFTRSQFGTGMSSRNLAKRLLSLLQYQADCQCKGTFTIEEIKRLAEDNGINKSKFFDVLSSLNIQGFLIKKSPNSYQLTSADS